MNIVSLSIGRHTIEYMLHAPMYVKFKNMQNQPMMIRVRGEVPFGGGHDQEGTQERLLEC